MMATMLAWDFLLHLPTTKWPTTSTGKQQSIDKRLACFVFFCCIVNQTDLGENKRNGIVFQLAGTPGRSSALAPKKKASRSRSRWPRALVQVATEDTDKGSRPSQEHSRCWLRWTP